MCKNYMSEPEKTSEPQPVSHFLFSNEIEKLFSTSTQT